MRTYGTVAHDPVKRAWRITCEPHVTIRLKRAFGRVNKNEHGTHTLSDTPENARELEWFLSRFPMVVEPAEYLARRASEQRDAESLVDRLLSSREAPPAFEMAIPPREYQRVAAAMSLANGGLLLADDLGLGKTASALCTLTNPKMLPTLVVTVTHLPTQWQREIAKFCPSLRTHIVQKGTPYDLSLGRSGRPCKARHRWAAEDSAAGGGRCTTCGVTREDAYHGRVPKTFPDVVIMNFHKLSGWAETIGPLVRSMIIDEAHELRRSESAKYSAAQHIRAFVPHCMGLTATPIFNYGGEIHSVMDVIRPGALGDYDEFVREWCTGSYGGDQPRIADPAAFGLYVRDAGLMLRRTRAEVGRELPAFTKIPHHVDLDAKAIDEVNSACSELARVLLREGEAFKGQKMHASEELSNKLRQATGIGKAPFVADFVRMLVEAGEKVLLFGWHREVYRIWMERLKDLSPVLFTGSENAREKEEAKTAFVSGRSKILIMSLRSGAGIDGLQHVCRTLVYGELDWSKGAMDQCGGRAYRDGQKDPVVAYYLIADSGADPIMADVLGVKTQQLQGLLDPKADLIESLDTGGGHMKKLAMAYLEQRGEAVEVAQETGT